MCIRDRVAGAQHTGQGHCRQVSKDGEDQSYYDIQTVSYTHLDVYKRQGSAKVFMTVTLPLIKDSFFSGLVTAFVRSITTISAIILLVTPDVLLITGQDV